jgi:sugar-specific transcriptional regulator TrmB
MDNKLFEELGFTDNERKIYLTLLNLGKSTAGPIVKKSGLHRGTTYAILERLIERGLVNYIIKSNRKHFQCANPNKLLEELKEKERKLKKVMPKLLLAKSLAKEGQKTEIFEGKKGIKTIFYQILKTIDKNNRYVCFGAPMRAHEMLGEGFFSDFHKQRIAKKVNFKIIHNEDAREIGKLGENLKYTKIKYLPKEYLTPTSIEVYGDNVAILLWEKKPTGILIKSKGVAKSFLSYFEMLWKIAEN